MAVDVDTLIGRLRTYTRASTATLTDAIGIEVLNIALDRMQETAQWRGQEKTDTSLVYTSSTNGLALPADFLEDKALYVPTNSSTPSQALTPIARMQARTDWWDRVEHNTVDGQSRYPATVVQTDEGPYYYIWAQKLYYVPNPTNNQNLTLDYYARLAQFTAVGNSNYFTDNYGTTLLWLAMPEVWAIFQEDERMAAAEARAVALLAQSNKNERQLSSAGGTRQRGT